MKYSWDKYGGEHTPGFENIDMAHTVTPADLPNGVNIKPVDQVTAMKIKAAASNVKPEATRTAAKNEAPVPAERPNILPLVAAAAAAYFFLM